MEAPVKVGLIKYPDGGGEMHAIPNCKRTRSGIGLIKEMELHEAEIRTLGIEKAAEYAQKRQEDRQARSQSESARRARSRVRRICRMYNLSVMVTLTFPGEGVHDYDTALGYVQNFIHDHGDILHHGGMWVAVPELHPSGHGWHWHVLVSRRFKKAELTRLWDEWTLYLGRKGITPSGGAQFVRVDVEQFDSAEHAASYAAKYVGKTFERTEGMKYRKRYLCKKKSEVVVEQGGAWCIDEVREFMSVHIDGYVYDSAQDAEWQGPPMIWGSW